MKKLLALILSFVLLLTLCACGGGTTSQQTTQTPEVSTDTNSENTTEETTTDEITLEEMLAEAEVLDHNALSKAIYNNIVNAKSTYQGKYFIVTGPVWEITEEYIVLSGNFRVYLPIEEIATINLNQYITIVGRANNLSASMTGTIVDFEDARISSTTFTYTGEYNAFHSTDGTHPQGVCLKYETDSGKTDYVRLALTDEQRDTLSNGMEITVEGKLFRNDDDTPYSASTKLEVETIK